jgi:hypothetical protein
MNGRDAAMRDLASGLLAMKNFVHAMAKYKFEWNFSSPTERKGEPPGRRIGAA